MELGKTSVGQTLQKQQTANVANKKLSFGNNENKDKGGFKAKDAGLMLLPGAGAAIGTFAKQEPKYDTSMLKNIVEDPAKFKADELLKDLKDKEIKHEAGDIKLEEKGAKNALNKATTTANEAHTEILKNTKLGKEVDDSVINKVAQDAVHNDVKSGDIAKKLANHTEEGLNDSKNKDFDALRKKVIAADKDSDLRKGIEVSGDAGKEKFKIKDDFLKLIGKDGKDLGTDDAGKLTKKADDAMSVFKKVATEISDKLPKVPAAKKIMIGTSVGTALALLGYAATSGGDKKPAAQKTTQKQH